MVFRRRSRFLPALLIGKTSQQFDGRAGLRINRTAVTSIFEACDFLQHDQVVLAVELEALGNDDTP
ncbi:hypothetical protein D3C86_2113890 [compost metagenome]